MTHAALLLLALLATDVTRSRTLTVPRGIERTVVRLGLGLAATYGNEARLPTVAQLMEGDLGDARIRGVLLYVDHRRDGLPIARVAQATATLARFALDRADPADSVELRYTLHTRGIAIQRRVIVTEGQIDSRAAFACALGPQGRCKHVDFRAVARESPQGTIITVTARVRANTGMCPSRSTSRFKVVNRLAGREIAKQLDGMLGDVEREGRQVASTGHDAIHRTTHDFLDALFRRWTR